MTCENFICFCVIVCFNVLIQRLVMFLTFMRVGGCEGVRLGGRRSEQNQSPFQKIVGF